MRRWIQGRNHGRERKIDNRNLCAAPDDLVKIDDVARTHPNASITGWTSDVPLFRRPVNVNGPGVGVGILPLSSAQPKNARYNWVAAGCINPDDLARSPAILEDRAGRCTVANLVGNLQFALTESDCCRENRPVQTLKSKQDKSPSNYPDRATPTFVRAY